MTDAAELTVEPSVTTEQSQPESVEVSGSSPEQTPESNDGKVTFSPEQQAVLDKVVAEKTFKLREIERQNEALQHQMQTIQQQQPTATAPTVPDIPDPYQFDTDEEYRAAVVNRDKKIEELATFKQQEAIQAAQLQQQQQLQLQQQQQQLLTDVQTYTERATKLGINQVELQQAGNQIAAYGINDQLTQFILKDDQGPLITKYLASNPTTLEQLSQLDPMSAAVYIATDVKTKAAGLKPKVPTAPEPVEPLRGNGVPPSKRGPAGATFK